MYDLPGIEPASFYCFGSSNKPRQRDFLLLTLTKCVQPTGIEPVSTVLHTAAITISAKVANLGRCMGIEPILTESQSVVLTFTLTTPLN